MGCLRSISWLCVKLPMGCLASLASSLWPYACSVVSEVAERVGLDKEEAVVVILGLFILGQNCRRWVLRKRRKRRKNLREHERRNNVDAYYQYRQTASLKHIQGSTAHKAPPKYTWTKYWEKVMGERPKWCPCEYPDGKRRELEWGKNGAVHGAHVLFQDIMGNSYGGIVPVTREANNTNHEYPIKYPCDVVTVLNIGQMTYVGSLVSSGSPNDQYRDPNDQPLTLWRLGGLALRKAAIWKTMPCTKENEGKECKHTKSRKFKKIKSVRKDEDHPRVIVEGVADEHGDYPAMRIKSEYTIRGNANTEREQQKEENQYIFLLANVMLMQDEEKPLLSEKHEPKIFRFRPGTNLLRPRESPAQCKNQNLSPPPMSLHNASKEGNIRVVQQWLDRRADVNQADEEGRTPLYVACKNFRRDTVRFLIERGANVDKAPNNGQTPRKIIDDHELCPL